MANPILVTGAAGPRGRGPRAAELFPYRHGNLARSDR